MECDGSMATLRVVGGRRLKGVVEVSGSKNAALALLPAALLCRGQVSFYRVPEIIDVHILLEIIKTLGVEVLFENETVRLDTTQLTPRPLPNGSVAQIRASIYLAGVLLTQFGEVTIGLPGGCPLNRQVDFHLDAFQRMGAKVWLELSVRAENSTAPSLNLTRDGGALGQLSMSCSPHL
jgi:UDP-N-acetylglucosamine 1-carboxyvinyltransferase